MKSLFVCILYLNTLLFAKHNQREAEAFYYIKCMIYVIASGIHSIILGIPIPIGAIIMIIIFYVDTVNRHAKRRMIYVGIIVFLLSNINYSHLMYPVQKLYMYTHTQNVRKIEVFAHSPYDENKLLTLTDPEELNNWTNALQQSKPYSSWNFKSIPSDIGYTIKVYSNDLVMDVFVSRYTDKNANIYVDQQAISYYNPDLLSLIHNYSPDVPQVLTINTSKDAYANIYNGHILNTLWREIIWSEKSPYSDSVSNNFKIPAYLFLDTQLGCRLYFSTDFLYAYIPNEGIMKLTPYLQTILSQQFILSHLDYVDSFHKYEASHIHTQHDATVQYSIELDDSGLYYGLYLLDLQSDRRTLLHTVKSPNTKFFILKSPYILLLDESEDGQYSLMLINQNVPEKHRYIMKNEAILPHSISICPQNSKFAYIVTQNDLSTLYLVSDYYHSPKSIANGEISDSLFLSDDQIVFTQKIDRENMLCVYNISQNQLVKCLFIPGSVQLLKAENHRVYFVVQQMEGKNAKQGTFYVDENLEIFQAEIPVSSDYLIE